MKLLEELDNQVEVAHEILTSEMSASSQNSINSAFKQPYNSNNGFSDFEMIQSNNFNNPINGNNMMG